MGNPHEIRPVESLAVTSNRHSGASPDSIVPDEMPDIPNSKPKTVPATLAVKGRSHNKDEGAQ